MSRKITDAPTCDATVASCDPCRRLPAASFEAPMFTHFRQWLVGVAALCATSFALPQGGAATPTLGNAKAGAKLLGFDELSLCLKQRDDLGQRKPVLQGERVKLDRERGELLQTDEALKADRAKVEQLNQTALDLSRRSKELSQQVSDFNERAAKFDAAAPSGPTGERQRRTLERDKAALDKAAADLQAERDALGPNAEALVKSYQARTEQRNQAADDWNQRSAALGKKIAAYDSELADWQADCEGRPYRADDEKLIKSGK